LTVSSASSASSASPSVFGTPSDRAAAVEDLVDVLGLRRTRVDLVADALEAAGQQRGLGQ
jgi:hypothetical protein